MAAIDCLGFTRRVASELRLALKAVSTGRSVSSAADNPTYWAIARQVQGDRATLETVDTSLDFAQVKLDIARTALDGVQQGIVRIQSLLVLGLEPGADRAKLGKEIDALRESIRAMIESAGVNGLNYLVADVPTASGYNNYPSLELSAAVVRRSDGTISFRTIDFSGKDLLMISTDTATAGRFATVSYLNAIAQPVGSTYPYIYYQLVGIASHYWVNARDITLNATTTTAAIKDMVLGLESVRNKVSLALTDLGLASARVDVQRKTNQKVFAGMDRQISTLIDADMTEAAARIKALEVRSALCTQMLALRVHQLDPVLLLLA